MESNTTNHRPKSIDTVASIKDNQNFNPKTTYTRKLRNSVSGRKGGSKVSFFDFATSISNRDKEPKYNAYRAMETGDAKHKYKTSQFPAYPISIDYDGEPTGLLCVDIDLKDNQNFKNADAIKSRVQGDVFIMVSSYSVTDGVFLIIKCPTENVPKEDLKAFLVSVFRALESYFMLQYGLKIDFLADPERLRIDSYDPNPYINWESQVYTDAVIEAAKPQAAIKQRDNFKLDSHSNNGAINFNNSGLKMFEVINPLNEAKGLTVSTANGKDEIFSYQALPPHSLRTVVAKWHDGIIFFIVKSSTFAEEWNIETKGYNAFDWFKILTGYDNEKALRELAKMDFGIFEEPTKLLKPSGKETYSLNMDFLEAKGIALNQLTGVIEINGSPLNDVHLSKFITELSLLSGKNQSKDILNSCIDVLANSNQSHPLLNYLKKLEQLAKTDFTKPTAIDRFIDCFESSTPRPLFRIYLVRWLLGLFDLHIHNRMTKLVLLLSGLQNSGKTSFAKNLLPKELKTYGKVVQYDPFKAVDNKVALCSTLIAVFDEAEDILSKSKTLSDYKALTSMYDILERRPFRRNPDLMFRSSIIMMTSNEKNVLNDSSGNSRFLTIDIQSFNLKEYLKIDLDLIWKEIHELHLLGESSVLNEGERALQEQENINFESEDFVCGLIQNVFYESKDGFLTATELLLEMEKHTKQPINLTKIGKALRKLNIERVAKKIKGKVLRGYNLKHRFEE